MMKKTALLPMILACCGAAHPQAAPVLNAHFDSREEVDALKKPDIAWKDDGKGIGKGYAALLPGKDFVGANWTLPKDTPEGVLTFWVYDPIFEPGKELTWVECGFTATIEKDGKPVNKGYSFVDFRGSSHGGWMFGTGLLTDQRETKAIRHAGWTRFDIVNPPGAEAQQFIVCVDGHEVFRTREKLLSLQSLGISVRGASVPVFFDEVSYDTDAASYRPNTIREARLARPALKAGAKLPVELQLDPKGARQPEGEVTLKVYDGAEREVAHSTAKIEWAAQGDKPLAVELPELARSGSYWIEASYSEKDLPLPDVTRARVDVQYVTAGFEKPTHGKLVLEGDWDFVPVESAEVPAAAPKEWTGADAITGLWFSRNGGVKNVSLAKAAWYHRSLEIPADWKDRHVILDIHDPQTVVHAFVDGAPVGEICWPGGSLDLTAQAKPGKKIDLALFVAPESLFGKNKVASEILGDKYKLPPWDEKANERGLGGEVALRGEPAGARIGDVAVRTSVEKKTLWVQFECAGLKAGQSYKIEAVASAAGKADKTLPPVSFKATGEKETVVTETAWEDPVLWEVGAPFLYSLNAKLAKGEKNVVDTIRPVRFGFREIATRGRLMTLNGKPLSLFDPRGVSEAETRNFGFCGWMREMGYNSAYRTNGYGSSLDPAFFDEAGIPRRMNASEGFSEQSISQLAQQGKERDPKFWDAYFKQIEYYIRRFRNSPSIFIWRGPFYTAETGLEMNPLLQDGIWLRAAESDLEQRKIDMGYRVYNFIHAFDPSRYQDDLTSLNYNDTINFHCYVGFSPIQEAIERNEHWIKYGTKPVFMDEWACPFITDWTNSPWEGGGGHTSPRKVPQVAEWCALTKGPEAFVRDGFEDAALKAFEKAAFDQLAAADKIEDPQKRAVAQSAREITKALPAYFNESTRNLDNLRDQVWRERTRELLLNWRADGVAGGCSFLGEGGMEPTILPQCYAPVTGFLAGTPEKRTAKDHLFAPGETLRRSALLLNNGREPAAVECAWKLVLGTETVAGKTEVVTIPAGGQMAVPIEVAIPAGGDRQGTLSMKLSSNGKELCKDECAIDVLAPQPFQNGGKRIALIDPEGDSAQSLEKIGVKFQLLPFNADLSGYDTIIFGRRAFDYELQCLAEGLDLGALTALGKNILVLEQTEKTLRERFKLRTEYASPRDVYGRATGTPLLAGLPDRCLKFWRGASTLTGGKEIALQNLQPPKGYRAGAWYPYTGNDGKEKKRYIKWGNTHNVATVVIVKPDSGNFRTLVDCEFALNYAAALELRAGRGNVVFSQLDVTARTQDDPAANRFLGNLVAYTRDLPVPELRKTVYLGGGRGASLLDLLRIAARKISAPSEAKPGELLVLGEADAATLAGWKDALAAFVDAGGTVFSLPKAEGEFGFLPFAVKTSAKAVNQSIIGPEAAPLLRGLGNADFYWKGDIQITALDEVDGASLRLRSGVLAQVPRGKGSYILCQTEPGQFDVARRFWLDRSRRFNERTLNGLLSNAGAELPAPYFLRPPKAKSEPAGSLELGGEAEICAGAASQETVPGDGPAWRKLTLPGGFQKQYADLAKPSGIVWYRRTFDAGALPPEGTAAELFIGQVSGCDRTFLNGVKIGQSDMNTHVNDVATAIRRYALPPGVLKPGKNEIALRVDFDRDNLLGLRGSDGSIQPPFAINFMRPAASAASDLPFEPQAVNQWRVCTVPAENLQSRTLPPKANWFFVGKPSQSYKEPSVFAHNGGFAGYVAFHMDPLDESAKPLLLLNGIAEGSVVTLAGKPLEQVNQKQKGGDEYSVERRYRLPANALITKPGEHNRLELWTPSVRKSEDPNVTPVSAIYLDDPDVLAERERQRKLRVPYLYEVADTEDPYVARHW